MPLSGGGTLYFTSIRKAKGEAFTPRMSWLANWGYHLTCPVTLQCGLRSSATMAVSSILSRSPPVHPDRNYNELKLLSGYLHQSKLLYIRLQVVFLHSGNISWSVCSAR